MKCLKSHQISEDAKKILEEYTEFVKETESGAMD